MERATGTATSACCIGAGRMGRAITRTAQRAGIRVTGSWTRSSSRPLAELLDTAEVAFLAVPDDAVAGVMEQLAQAATDGQLVMVTSGAAQVERLAAVAPRLRVARLHPMQAVGADAPDDVLDGAVAAITAADPSVLTAAAELARRLGMRPVELDDHHAPTWHAAGTIAAGGVVATLAAARDLAIAAGVDADAALDALGALAASAIAQARAGSPERALTGPVARGDHATVDAHRTAILAVAPHLLELYDALADRAAQVAGGPAVPGATS